MEELAPDGQVDAGDRCPRCGASVGALELTCASCGGALAAAPELPVGFELAAGRYRITSVIGRGGFGITYAAIDGRLHREVAIKELFPEHASRDGSQVLVAADARVAFRAARDRFLREARVLARFTHPGIVRVYEVFEEHGTAYLVMELLGGCTLVDVLRARDAPFDQDEVLDVAGRVAAALRPVHAAGVLHRDLNPSNVMLTEHGRIVLIDFGLARDFDPAQTMGMTRVVTPGYAPMEQYHGEGRFGPATDVYGLAASLYRLATGRVPVAAIARSAGEPLPSPHRLNPTIDKQVSDALLDGLELEPSHRPRDLDAFLARLGVRCLPDGTRSLLLGSPGAEPDRLRTSGGHATPADADADRTEVVPPPAGAPAPPPAATPAPAPALEPPPPAVDPDATRAVAEGTAVLAGRPEVRSDAAGSAAPIGAMRGQFGRRRVTVPLALVAIAVASAAPVLGAALLVLVALPVLATIGDAEARRLRIAHGIASGWAGARAPSVLVAPVRFVRNVAASVLRSSPILGMGAVAMALWELLARTSLAPTVLDVLLRLVGGGTAAAILAASAQGSARFRSGLGVDVVVDRAMPAGRTTQRVVVGWLVVVVVVCAALWLDPDPFPLS